MANAIRMTAAQSTGPLKGTVVRYISQPRDDGWAILAIRTPKGQAKICGKGLGGLKPGQVIEASGKWSSHPRYGEQFQANDVREIVPEDGAGLIRWLVQTGIPGVGEATARKLVALFGENTIARIAAGDDRAKELLGQRFADAQQTMVQNQAEAAFGPKLAEHDIGPALRAKIFKKYGLETAKQIEEDPYRLISDIDGIAFATADRIAQANGVNERSRSRLVAAAIDSLRTAANDGHTAVDCETLRRAVTWRTNVNGPLIDALLNDLDCWQAVATVVVDKNGNEMSGWALRYLDQAEATIAEKVLDKIETPARLSRARAEHYVARAEALLAPKTLNAEQREGAIQALSRRFSILTGGPGTGKTFTLNVICVAWRLAARDGLVGENIENGAPTGKASQRMRESTGINSSTVHRLLGVDSDTGGFIHDENNPLEADFIAIDESSMKDVPLAASFMRAWGDAHVILIGDADQLASVGPGRVLGDLIDSGVVPVTRLIEIRRQAEGSAIAAGAQSIREGRLPVMEVGTDLMFIECEDNAKVAEMVGTLHAAYLADGEDVQVLTPGHQSEVGTAALNQMLQEAAGNGGAAVRIGGGATARAGDKVIQTANDHGAHVYNGDSGTVAKVGETETIVHLSDRKLKMTGDALRKLELAYALSVHKSQGSEYDVVIMPLTVSHWSLLRRTLFYTGLTRAKKTCIVLGSRRALRQAIGNDDARARTTTLVRRLINMKAA